MIGGTHLFVALFLPLRDQHGIRVAVLQQPVVELLADRLLLVVELVDVPTSLVRDLEYGPLRLVLGNVVGRRVLRVLHLVAEDEQVILDVTEAVRWRLALRGVSDGGHVELVRW